MLLKTGLVLLGLFAGSLLSPEELAVLQRISESGRCVSSGDTPDSRIGRPPLEKPKQQISLQLDPDVVAAYRSTGAGWQKLMRDALAKAAPRRCRGYGS